MSTRVRSRRVRSRRRLLGAHERGTTTLEIVIIFPMVILITFGVIQGALWYNARSAALAAAEEGARAAAESNPRGAAAEALGFIADLGGDDVLRGASVSVGGGANEVTVTVSGNSLSMFPGWGGSFISQTASAPIERFTVPN